MKILLSAIACDPYRGSEAHFGWNAARALATRHEVWILGHAKDAAVMKQACEEGLIGKNVRFFPHSSWGRRHTNRIISRLQNWRDYGEWSKQILPTAQRLQKEIGFDIVHHVTLSTWRVPSQLWRLGVPFIWGPIGGGEIFPLRLLPLLSPASAVYEILRRAQNTGAQLSAQTRTCIQNSAHVFASTPETARAVRELGCGDGRVSLLSSAFFSESQIARLARAPVDGMADEGRGPFSCMSHAGASPGGPQTQPSPAGKPAPATLRLFAGGDIEGRKGHALALRALAECKARGLRFCYHIAGMGPEATHLLALATRLGIQEEVSISPPFAGEQYLEKLFETDVYLLPSLRDNAPVTLMEAMLAGCVPVVASCGGPGYIVTDDSGIRIPVGSAREMVNQIVSALLRLSADRPFLNHLRQGARERIAGSFHEKNYLESIDEAYCLALVRAKDMPAGPPR